MDAPSLTLQRYPLRRSDGTLDDEQARRELVLQVSQICTHPGLHRHDATNGQH